MKPAQISTRSLFLLLLSTSFLLVACSLLTSLSGSSAKENAAAEGQGDLQPQDSITEGEEMSATSEAVENLIIPTDTPVAQDSYDLSQAGLPAGFPIHPAAFGFSGVPGTLLEYSVDANVRAASDYYDKAMKDTGWSGFATGGVSEGSCGGDDCGPVPTKIPGPTPTATPEGWMGENLQYWSKGTANIIINFEANDGGGTDISIMFVSP